MATSPLSSATAAVRSPSDRSSLSPELLRAAETLRQLASQSGADRWDIVAAEGKSDGLSLSKGGVDSIEITGDRIIGIRLFREGSPGYASSERLTEEALRQMVRDAVEHAELSGKIPVEELPRPEPLPELSLRQFDPTAATLTLAEMEQFALALDRRTRSLSRELQEITHLGVERTLSSRLFLNSNGVESVVRRSAVSAGIQVAVERNHQMKTGYRGLSRRGREALDLELLSDEALSRGIEMLGAAPVESGEWPVVLDRRISGQLVALYSSALFAQQVQKGVSFLADHKGKTVASPLITLRDLPHHPDLFGSRALDGEGVPTRPATVIENGLLLDWLYNLESAGRAGVAPTGHGVRGSGGAAATSFSNLVIDPGTSTFDQLLRLRPRMLLLTRLEGAAGCSPVSGELSIGAQGFLIEGGEVVRPVDSITISGHWLNLFRSVEGVSNRYDDPFSSVQVPDLFLPSVRVSG